MWDNPRALNLISGLLVSAALLLAAYAAVHYVIRLPAFPIREVSVRGDIAHVTVQQVEEIVKRELRGTFFTLDLGEARAAFEKLPWVRAVHVRKQWPGMLDVVIEEHTPLARWRDQGLVNTSGVVFVAAFDGKLPVFSGPQGSAKEITIQFEYFKRSLAAIGEVPAEVSVSARRAWQLKMESGMVIELGRGAIESRLDRFVSYYQRALPHVQNRVAYADLRYPNGFAIRAPEFSSKPRPAPDAVTVKRG